MGCRWKAASRKITPKQVIYPVRMKISCLLNVQLYQPRLYGQTAIIIKETLVKIGSLPRTLAVVADVGKRFHPRSGK